MQHLFDDHSENLS